MNFLSARTPRERYLILGALALVALFAIWQFGFKSVLNAQAAAEQRHAVAMKELKLVRTQAPNLAPAQTSTNRASFDRTAAINTARGGGVDISRIQPGTENSVQVWLEDSAMTQVYSFMTRLSAGYNVEITRVQITRQEGGMVAAQMTLKPIS